MNLTFKDQLAKFVEIDQQRTQKRLEKLEQKKSSNEIALTCQSDNICRSYRVKNKSYYDKNAVALQTNIERFIWAIGEKYCNKEILQGCKHRQDYIERVAREHIAELTITIPHQKNEDLAKARKRFCEAFHNFNRRFLKEKASAFFGDFVRVFEPHKDGVLHAHILIECKKSLKRGSLAFRWYKCNGNFIVSGETVANWVRDVWQMFRQGNLAKYGIGEIHTLQPIRKGVKCFAKYISKYITKSLTARPLYMKGLRVIAYSQSFLAGSRLKVYDYDKAEKITYFSKTKKKWLTRYKRFQTFSINCASNRARGRKLLNFLKFLGVPLETVKGCLGSNWYWQIRNAVHFWRISKKQWKRFSKWEKFATVRNALGDKFKCLLKFKNEETVFRYEDFMKISSEEKAKKDFSVIGFIENGSFVSVKKAMKSAFEFAMKNAWKIREILKNRLEFKSKLQNHFQKRSEAWQRFENGNLSVGQWHNYLEHWQYNFEVITSGVKRWIDDLKPAPKTENKIEYKQMILGV